MKLITLLLYLLVSITANADTTHNIDIFKFKFSPPEITIKSGDTIRWTNKEKRQYHNVWFEQSGEAEPDYLFPEDFFEKTFSDIGDFPYRCGPHPKMIGIVHVLKAEAQSIESEALTTYSVESVEDGDTIVIQYMGKSQRVQLIGIDAPEDTQNPKLNLDAKRKKIDKDDLLDMGTTSTNHLKTLIQKGSKVSLQGNLSQKDKYNRLPAIVINEKGESLNQAMVEAGYALLLTRFSLNENLLISFKKAQEQAKSQKLGLWISHPELMEMWSK